MRKIGLKKMDDAEIIREPKRAVNGEWEYFITPSFLKIIKRLIFLAEKYLENKKRGAKK